MAAFASSVAVGPAKLNVSNSSFVTPTPKHDPVATKSNAPTMILLQRVQLRRPVGSATASYGRAAKIFAQADKYMSSSVRKQYLAMANPFGTFGVQCTEGSVKFAADFSRIRSLHGTFRRTFTTASKSSFDMYENRKAAIVSSHGCHHEETQFCDFKGVASTYITSKREANGSCSRYAAPETVEEAAMLRYMDIQQNIAANPTGVYNVWCNEGAAKFQAEDVRVAALNTAFRQGQKSMGKLMDEKYQQKKKGYAACHNCTYEESLVSRFPAIGAAFRPKNYGY